MLGLVVDGYKGNSEKCPARSRLAKSLLSATLLAGSALPFAAPVNAQTTTGSIRGDVFGATAGQTVTAINDETGFRRSTQTDAEGNYAINGLPPGTYRIETESIKDDERITENLRLQVGQRLVLDLVPQRSGADEIVVVGRRTSAEVITSEIATNVTTEQIETLPQGTRNFLNFAQLAPGVRVSRNEFNQTFGAGATNGEADPLAAGQTNVFIDGVSLKSNIQQGGIVGQDSSRGNPFSQLAIQEFRVLTQNFKAEFEQAASAVITAVTKSGTNEFHGEAFGLFARDEFQSNDFLSESLGNPTPEFSRNQYGFSLGGPIVKDKLFFFLTYEANDQDRVNIVTPGGTPEQIAALPFDINDVLGTQVSPFREDLYFGKINWIINEDQNIEFTVSYRDESDIRNFGGQNALSRAENIENEVLTLRLRHQYNTEAFLNEFSIDYLDTAFRPSPLNPDTPGQNFAGVISIGGAPTIQEVEEQNITLRNNITFTPIDFLGSHVIKAGVRISAQDYSVLFQQFGNPLFNFEINSALNSDFNAPINAQFGVGDPLGEATNIQFGAFVQTDWDVTDKLQLNLGLRWDFETNANNRDFVTPQRAVDALQELEAALIDQPGNFFFADDFISTGDNRTPFLGAFGPRAGFSYDVFGNTDTVIFGGYGRFFDRTLFRNAAEETILTQFILNQFEFSVDGAPRPSGQPTIQFDPAFFSAEGLTNLIATNSVPSGELRAIRNDLRPPRSDQFTFGIRQRLGPFKIGNFDTGEINTSFSYSHIRGNDDIGFFPANRSPEFNDAGFLDFIPVTGFNNIIVSSNDRATRFNGFYATIDKPYSRDSGWGINVAYTLSFAEQRGFLFNFDFPNVEDQPFVPNAADERHRLVVSGIVDLPLGFRASTLTTLASGPPPFIINALGGFGENVELGNFIQPPGIFSIKQVDLRLEHSFDVFGLEVINFVEAQNIFNAENGSFGTFFVPPEAGELPDLNQLQPNLLAGPARTIQFGARVKF